VASASDATGVPRISKEKVKAVLGKQNVIVVGVRVGADRDTDGFKTRGAIPEDLRTIEKWFRMGPEKGILIFYCA
jgi:hypothetical protein